MTLETEAWVSVRGGQYSVRSVTHPSTGGVMHPTSAEKRPEA